jgi:uncharacterized protein YicC (UPF0701 family)
VTAVPPTMSMTGFGEGRARGPAGEAVVRIGGVNHKGAQAQVAVRGDLHDPALEDELRTRVRDALERGAVTVQVALAPARALAVDPARLVAAWRELAAAAAAAGAPVPTLEGCAHLVGGLRGDEDWAVPVRAAAAQALAAVAQARAREGAALGAAMAGHAAALRRLAAAMAVAAQARAARYREALQQRLAEVLAQQVAPELLVRELALHAERIDVTEEQVRLAAHLDALDALLAGGGAIGRRLDFLLQEVGREVNTTGSKANDAALQALVVDAKCLVDQLKEQAANLV